MDKKTERIEIRLSKKEKKALQNYCLKNKISFSDFFRRCISDYTNV